MSAPTRWILLVVGFLVANLLAMGVLVFASTASRAQVIPNYYEQAATYDRVLDEAARSHALGWRIERVTLDRELAIEVRDAAGAPLDGARVHVAGYPRAHAARVFERELAPRGGGRYVAASDGGTGLHDLAIVIERGGDRFTARLTVDPVSIRGRGSAP